MSAATTQRPATRRAPAAVAKLPYPLSYEHPVRLHWLAEYFCDLAKSEALKQLSGELARRRRPLPMRYAIYSAMGHQSKECKMSFDYVVSEGLLPYAFEKTTIFDVKQVAS